MWKAAAARRRVTNSTYCWKAPRSNWRRVTVEHVEAARSAWRRFGEGNHRAALNFGDCFAYALAKTTSEPLLFKGEDFARTDIEPA